VPVLINKGRDSTRRPDFSADEYRKLIRVLPSWIDKGREGKSRDMRHLLRDYVLILANTGWNGFMKEVEDVNILQKIFTPTSMIIGLIHLNCFKKMKQIINHCVTVFHSNQIG
jgi:hypothetical protein